MDPQTHSATYPSETQQWAGADLLLGGLLSASRPDVANLVLAGLACARNMHTCLTLMQRFRHHQVTICMSQGVQISAKGTLLPTIRKLATTVSVFTHKRPYQRGC